LKTTSPDLKALLKDPGHFLSFGFGSGLSPVAPGTMGTLITIPVYLALIYAGYWVYAGFTVFSILIGVYLCQRTVNALGVHDHPAIVWDEVAGYLITMLFVPATIYTVIAGFIVFRIFDILKPWPICALDQRVKGGLGVMVDDVVAGIYSAGILWFVYYAVLSKI
jgi:phosphatidylglycerophosphatase A